MLSQTVIAGLSDSRQAKQFIDSLITATGQKKSPPKTQKSNDEPWTMKVQKLFGGVAKI